MSRYIISLTVGCWLSCTSTAPEASDRPLFVLEGPIGSQLQDFAITPDGQMLVVGRVDGAVEVRSATTGELLNRIVHSESMRFESLSPDGRYFLARNRERSKFWLWDLRRKEIHQTLEMPESVHKFYVATFSPDDKKVLTCENARKMDPLAGTSKQLGLWDVETGERLRTVPCPRGDLLLNHHHEYARNFAFSPDGRKALIVYNVNRTGTMISGDYQELWDTVSWHPIRGRLYSWASSFTPDSRLYACTNYAYNKPMGLLTVETGDVVSSFGGPASYIQLSPDGHFAVSSVPSDKGYTLWTPHTGGGGPFYPGYDPFPRAVFYPDSRAVAIRYNYNNELWGVPNSIAVWDISHLAQSNVGKEAGEY